MVGQTGQHLPGGITGLLHVGWTHNITLQSTEIDSSMKKKKQH